MDSKIQKLFINYYLELNSSQFSTHSFIVQDLDFINDKVLAVATSHIPYMRVILVEIPDDKENNEDLMGDTVISNIKTFYDKILSNIAAQISNNKLSQPIIRYCPMTSGLLLGKMEVCLQWIYFNMNLGLYKINCNSQLKQL